MNVRFEGTPATWVWHDIVPDHLNPRESQRYAFVGYEWWYQSPWALFDCQDGDGRVACRYAAHVVECWDPMLGWRGRGAALPSWMPWPGITMKSLHLKVRPRLGQHKLICEIEPRDPWRLRWNMTMYGCYVPPPAEFAVV